ncbi:MAG: peptidylprolyl isomerase [Candidatus Brocadiales bacterium]
MTALLGCHRSSVNGKLTHLSFRQTEGFPVKTTSKSTIIPVVSIAAFLIATNSFIVQAQDDKVVAIVNGENVYSSEIEKRLKRYEGIDPALLPDIKNEILDEIVIQLVVAQFLEKEGIQLEEQVVEDTINNLRESLKSNPRTAGQTLETLLSTLGSSMEQLKNEIKSSIGLRRYFSQRVDDSKLLEYFNANKGVYGGEMLRASHILLDTRALKTKKEFAAAFDKIHDIKGQLDGGADFAELAKKYSNCPSAQKGGDLGFFPRKGVMVEPFAEAAFKLKVGEVSEPVQTQFGFHIIKVTDRKEAKDVKFEEVKQQVEENYINEETEKLIEKQVSEANIERKGFD